MGNHISLKLSKCEVDGKTAGYLSGGVGPTLLFIHGWAVNPYIYKVALDLAARSGYRVIAPFLPGFGLSESFPGPWPSSNQVSEWIESFLEASREDRPSVVAGHSLGGGFSASYASDFPGKIDRVFLLSSVGGKGDSADDLVKTRSALEWSLSLSLDLLVSQASTSHVVSIVGSGIIQLIRDPIGLWRLSRIARDYQICEELAKIAQVGVKIFVIGAVSDKVIPRDSVINLAKCASVEPVWVTGTHSWISTHPQNFAGVIANCR